MIVVRRLLIALMVLSFLPVTADAQPLTGSLVGRVKDEQGGVLVRARVRVSSPALFGGSLSAETDERGQLRLPVLPPGVYTLEVEVPGFRAYRESDIRIGVGATIERVVVLTLTSVERSIVVEAGSRTDARDPGFSTRFTAEDMRTIPTRRVSMFDFIRAAPGVSPTSPGSPTATTVSAFGSGTNENKFLIDGTNFTCPCSGFARAEPGIDFIEEVHVQSIGASAEFGNIQGAVINIVTRQGSDRFLYDAAYYGQAARLTSQPVQLPSSTVDRRTGYERIQYRDFTTNVGGPVVRNRAWFFGGYQHLRDSDSQPGAEPDYPRRYEQDKIFGRITWKPAAAWQLGHSVHNESWLNPEVPTRARPFEATSRTHGSIPAITFADLRHAMSATSAWDFRVARFVYTQESSPAAGPVRASHTDEVTGITTGAPPVLFALRIARTTAKATMSHYRPRLFGVDHDLRFGGEVERGGHDVAAVIPTGVMYVDRGGAPFLAIFRAPSRTGGLFVSGAAFVSDAISVGSRTTIHAGLRFDHSRAISPELRALDLEWHKTDERIPGAGKLYRWNMVSPRLGVATKLTADGRTMLRGSYGRFRQGMLTAEFEEVHPGVQPRTTYAFDPNTGGYSRFISTVDSRRHVQIDPATRAPKTDEYSVGVDRALGRSLALAVAYVRKNGSNFIGWQDIRGLYERRDWPLSDGRTVPVLELVNSANDRLFLLTNPEGFSLLYNGVVIAAEKRRANGWQASGSYTFSRTSGLQASSGAPAAGGQISSIIPPGSTTFGRDPNNLTNARGRLPNDRPHIVRVMGSLDVPRSGVVVAAHVQHFSGKPWAATAQVSLSQGSQRILLEPPGSRRLSTQTLLDVRVSRAISVGRAARVELLLDILNALNDTAEEALVSDAAASPNFGRPSIFMDPRRAMLGVKLNFGR